MPLQPPDELRIRELIIRPFIGVTAAERRKRQDIAVDITLYAHLRKACRSDRLEDSIDYSAVKQRILDIAEASRCRLIERLAQLIADACLEFDHVESVRVTVRKPNALRFSRCTEVEIVRERRRH